LYDTFWSALSVTRFSSFAPVASSKNEGLAENFDDISNHSLLFSVWSISRLFNKKAREKMRLAGALPNFGLDNLLNEGISASAWRICTCS
jgi:hypothetical protein